MEIGKAEKKRAFQQAAQEKLLTGMKAPEYETKKPLSVREKEAQKVQDLQVEIDALTTSIEGFLKLKD